MKTDGNDASDGSSLGQAWRTIGYALKKLKGGDTLYLQPGIYRVEGEIEAQGDEANPIFIRGRGRENATIAGATGIRGSTHLRFERLSFAGEVRVEGGSSLGFENCQFGAARFGMEATGVANLSLQHCDWTGFSQAGLELRRCLGVLLSGNLFDNRRSPAVRMDKETKAAILLSDYNSYANASRAWQVGSEPLALSALRKTSDTHSQALSPSFVEERGHPKLAQAVPFAAAGPLGKPIGTYRRKDERAGVLAVSGLAVHSVSATTANLEWATSTPATCEIGWGETPACESKDTFDVYYSGSYSLTGLKPGRSYYFKIRSLRTPDRIAKATEPAEIACGENPVSFTTLAKNPAPRSYYVSNDGNDARSGLSRREAWKTIRHAAGKANVGDIVLIAGGTYQERVRIRATGEEGAPITFKSVPGEKVVLDGLQKSLNSGFYAAGKSHLRFDGFYLREFNFVDQRDFAWWPLWIGGDFVLYHGHDIQITRCFSDGRAVGETASFVNAWKIADLAVKNCVVTNKMSGMLLQECPDLRLENNVFAVNMITAFVLTNEPGQKAIIEKNIFTDNLQKKAALNICLVEVERAETLRQKENCYYLRHPKDGRIVFQFVQHKGKRVVPMTIPQFEAEMGAIQPVFANPDFAGALAAAKDSGPQAYSPDLLMDRNRKMDFADYFATNPELTERDIGLQRGAFLHAPPRRGGHGPKIGTLTRGAARAHFAGMGRFAQ